MNAVRGYHKDGKLSASQLATWVNSKTKYIARYINGEEMYETKYLRFGKEVHEAIELQASQDEALMYITQCVPVLAEQELHVSAEVEIKGTPVTIHGYWDTYGDNVIVDYKTGKGKWSDQDVKNRLQFKFYAYLHQEAYGVLPEEIKVVHIKTGETTDGRLYVTGEIEEYSYKPTKKDVTEVKKIIAEFLEWNPELEVPENVQEWINMLVDNETQIKELKRQVDGIKTDILEYFEDNNVAEFKNEAISVYWSERKKYEYPQNIQDAEQAVKLAKKDFEQTATPEVTRTLNYRVK